MAGGWAYTIGVAAFMALAIDVRGQGTEDPGAKVAEEKCATCHSLPDEPDTGIAPSITDVANTQAVWTDIDLRTWLPRQHGTKADIDITSEDAYFLARYLQSQKQNKISAPKN